MTIEVRRGGTIVPGLDFRPAALGLFGLAAFMFVLTALVRHRARKKAT